MTIVLVTIGMSIGHPECFLWSVDRSPGYPRRWLCVEHVHTFPDHGGVVSLPHLELIVPLLGQQSSNMCIVQWVGYTSKAFALSSKL